MADLTPKEMASKLMTTGFERQGPNAATLTDPIADTPMVVTLDQLRPYDHDPRITRNPSYEEIKASIRERGLDAPPTITRRPGDSHYIIRNGGNTRLAILRELWTETKDERFFRIPCLFRPWPSRGEVVMLTGHLAENELRGGLTFIERSLGVEKARQFYEAESGAPLTQSELARRLTADGYPVQQSHISRMQDAVRYLLPAIPNVLYGGLGRHQIERLAVLRRACERVWDRRVSNRDISVNFGSLFQEVLTPFDAQGHEFSVQRVQDELVGEMADLLQAPYDTLLIEVDDTVGRQRALTSEPAPDMPASSSPSDAGRPPAPHVRIGVAPPPNSPVTTSSRAVDVAPKRSLPPLVDGPHTGAETIDPASTSDRLQAHIVSPASTTERLISIQRLVADELGDPASDFATNAVHAIPVQAGGLYPISDVWYIEPGLDVPERLRVHTAQLAREIAEEAGAAGKIEVCDTGVGFCIAQQTDAQTEFAVAVLTLLHTLSGAPVGNSRIRAEQLASVLQGRGDSVPRLSDTGLIKLFRLIRLTRRLVDLQTQRPNDHQERST